MQHPTFSLLVFCPLCVSIHCLFVFLRLCREDTRLAGDHYRQCSLEYEVEDSAEGEPGEWDTLATVNIFF